jgi:hypothetical protein
MPGDFFHYLRDYQFLKNGCAPRSELVDEYEFYLILFSCTVHLHDVFMNVAKVNCTLSEKILKTCSQKEVKEEVHI